MKDEMMAKIMDEVMKKMGGTDAPAQSMACEAPQGINEDLCGLTEYVGTAMGHTIGLVIANLDYSVHELSLIHIYVPSLTARLRDYMSTNVS